MAARKNKNNADHRFSGKKERTAEEDLARAKEKRKRIKTITSTQNYLPIRDVQEGIIITTDDRFIKLMEFSPINFDLRSDDEQAAIITQFASVLRSMNHTIQFKVVTKRADVESFIDRIYDEMQTETNKQCVELQKEQINLIANVSAVTGVTRRFFVAFEYEEPLGIKKKPTFRAIVEDLDNHARRIRNALRQCGNEQISIDGDDYWTLSALYSILCRRDAETRTFDDRMVSVIANYAKENYMDLSSPDSSLIIPIGDFIAPSYIDPSNSPKHVIVDDLYYTFGYIAADSYPIHAAGGWPQILMNLGEGIDIDMWVHKEDPANIKRKLQYTLRFNKVKMRDTEDTNQDYDDLASAIESGYYLKNGISSGDDFSYFGTLVTITAKSLADLNYRYTEVKNYCIRADLQLRPCNFQQMDAFNMALPLCQYTPNLWKKMRRNLLLSQFASAYPFTSFEMTDEDGILLGTNVQNGSLVFVDNFDTHKYNNANMTILGQSGSGKTYFMYLLALRMRQKKQQVFIVAPLKGFEFERGCKAVGGQYIKIAPGSGQNINVMEIRKKDDSFNELVDGKKSDSESILAKKIQQLHTFFTLLIEDIRYEEKQILDEALIKTYERFGITTKNQSLIDPENPSRYRKMPTLGDLHAELKDLGRDAHRLYSILTRYVSGSVSSFNAQTNVDLNNQFIVLDVSDLTKEMLSVGMFIALDYVWDKARENRTTKKVIFVDETWQLIGPQSSALAAEFVMEIFKVIRGYGGSAVAATQDINDFFALEGGRFGTGIINNSRIKVLLKSEPKEAETLRGVLDLTTAEIERVKMMERGTGLLVANSNHVFIKFQASKGEHDLITTDARDLRRIANEKEAASGSKRRG